METSTQSLDSSPSGQSLKLSRTISQSQNHVLSEKVLQTLQIPTDTPAMLSSWAALASISASNPMGATGSTEKYSGIDAKTVRTAMEMDALHQALAFQAQLETLVQQVRHMKGDIQAVKETATQLLHTLQTDKTRMNSSTSNSLEDEQQLAQTIATAFARRDQAKLQYSTLSEFFNKFDLSTEESLLLDTFSVDDYVLDTAPKQDFDILTRGMHFLQALDKVQDIRVQLMQRLEDKNYLEQKHSSGELNLDSTSTLRMMKSFLSRQEKAYQRLYESLCSLFDTNNNANKDYFFTHPFFPKALSMLHRDTPAYYSHLVDLFANARRATVTRDFLIALTAGNPLDSSAKMITAPLERMAHDPVNYVGDMLAHVFQCLSDECDLVRSSLFNFTMEEEGPKNMERDVAKVLHHILGGLIRPLRGRISAVLASLTRRPTHDEDADADDSDEDSDWIGDSMETTGYLTDSAHSSYIRRLTSLYSICGLLIFYYEKMSSSLGENDSKYVILHATSSLSEESGEYTMIRGIKESLIEAMDAFSVSLRVYVPMLERPHTDAASMVQSPSHSRHAHDLIRNLCAVHNSSPGFAVDFSHVIADDSTISFSSIGDMVIGATLLSCDHVDDISTLHSLLGELTLAGVANYRISEWEDKLITKERSLIDSFISKETLLILDRVGMGEIIRALDSLNDDTFPDEPNTSLSTQRIQSTLTRFYTALRSSPIQSYEEIIKNLKLRKYARSMIAEGIAKAYARLYSFIGSNMSDIDSGSLQRYTPDQVRTLLEV